VEEAMERTVVAEGGEVMGYFDGLTEASFKRDAEGRMVFYRWGVGGNGHVLRDEARAQQLRKFLRLYYMVSFPAIVVASVALGWLGTLALAPVLYLWYFLATSRMLRGLEATSVRLTFAESFSASSRAHKAVTLAALLMGSAFFGVCGTFTAIMGHPFLGVLSLVVSGACIVAIGYMVRTRLV
jgi:hypothetical protein